MDKNAVVTYVTVTRWGYEGDYHEDVIYAGTDYDKALAVAQKCLKHPYGYDQIASIQYWVDGEMTKEVDIVS